MEDDPRGQTSGRSYIGAEEEEGGYKLETLPLWKFTVVVPVFLGLLSILVKLVIGSVWLPSNLFLPAPTTFIWWRLEAGLLEDFSQTGNTSARLCSLSSLNGPPLVSLRRG